MNDLVLNQSTELALKSLLINRPQSIILTGEKGVGLMSIAKYIAAQYDIKPQIILPEKNESIDQVNGIIGIDMIREIKESTKSKTQNGRIIIIDDAEKMTPEAQNAFLKLLEEPNQNTFFILLSHLYSNLLKTTLSRLQKIQINNISSAQSIDLLDELKVHDTKKRAQLLFIANGLPAEIKQLSDNEEYFLARSEIIIDAKKLIQSRMYEKLAIIHKYKDSRDSTLKLLDDTLIILKTSLLSNPNPECILLINKILEASLKIINNTNIRLVLAEIFI